MTAKMRVFAPAAAALTAAVLFRIGPTLGAAPQGQNPPPATPQAGAQAPPPGQGPGAQGQAPGGRGGRGNPAGMLFTDQCAGCHGTDLAGGRAPSLFDEKWLAKVDDARIIKSITDGVPGTEMEGFKGT